MSDLVVPSPENSQIRRHLLHDHGIAKWLTTTMEDLEPGGRLHEYIQRQRGLHGMGHRFEYQNVNDGYLNDIEDLLDDEENDIHFDDLEDLHNAFHDISDWRNDPRQALGREHTHPKTSWKQRYRISSRQ